MAITQKGFFFQGLSTDAKPTSGISANDRFLEADTRKEYVWSGTAWLLAGAAVDIFDKFREFIDWSSLDGYTVGGDAGYSIHPEGCDVVMVTTDTQNDSAWLRGACWRTMLDAGKVITAEFILLALGQGTDVRVWLRLDADVVDPPSDTARHFGWYIIYANLYASNADGTTQTISDTLVDLDTTVQRTRLKMVFTPGEKILFYVNDVLKITHTTNLPAAPGYKLLVQARTLSADSVKASITLGRVLVEKEHA